MKIKRKVEMNLPQLIEWAMKNEIKDKVFNSNDRFSIDSVLVEFDYMGRFGSENNISKHKKFTVEVEEEITLTTPLPSMLHIWKTEVLGTEITEIKNKSIASQYTVCSIEFWLKKDDEMTLIWTKEKGLVE
ncbi:hypothetical protein NGH54_12830 [Staphylococcus xylosus]|uniref:hypothetical protein n=1 Tax=Staphylococcus xylosus TaxID=1288 RepID=UPI002DBA74A5|nr:hypothetical protein [Staphylococcus xylosus]MEB8071602.1 hypothetical protein [Staphylococcus xylosus]